MKHLLEFQTFKSDKNDLAIGLDIKNEYSKLINGDTDVIEIGKVDQVADSAIYNLKQTYPDTTIDIIDGRYVMRIK